MFDRVDPVLGSVVWGTALCASLLAHGVISFLDPPAKIQIEEVRIEVVSPRPVTAQVSNATDPEGTGPQVDTGPAGDAPEDPTESVDDAKKADPAVAAALETPGLFREGPKRPSLFERNRAYAARQRQLKPLQDKLARAEASTHHQSIDLDATYDCSGDDVRSVLSTRERDVGHWAPFVPHQLLTEKYAEGLSQILARDAVPVTRKGYVELALPAERLVLELEEPRGGLLSVGLGHARCAVGLSHTARGFPMTWRRLPVRLVTPEGRIVSAVVDATLHEDASFLLRAIDGTELPFRTGRVEHGDEIASRLSTLSSVARLLQ